MVQEWQGAYMDYTHLKKLLEKISKMRDQNAPSHPPRKGPLGRKLTLYRAFSGLTGRIDSPLNSPRRKDEEVISVTPMQQHEGSQNYYQTVFLKLSEEGAEYEIDFFKKLDDEFNKVLKFYEAKVEGVKEEAEELSKQMDALIAMRIKVDKPSYDEQHNQESSSLMSSVLDTENQGE